MNTGDFKVGDSVTVRVEWATEIKGKRAKIFTFQKNGKHIFANLVWARDHSYMDSKYGSKFALEELVKV